MTASPKIRVLIVDDSAVVRRALFEALSKDPEIEVVGTACDPYVARDRILQLNPDVLTLDVEMPRMDGLTFLRTLMQNRPMPVVIFSSVTPTGSQNALDALAAGAIEVIPKPNSAWTLGELQALLPHRVKNAARARLGGAKPGAAAAPSNPHAPAAHPPVVHPPVAPTMTFNPRQLILIGASTGGTEAIKSVLSAMPPGLPGICIVQHIPAGFSTAFAARLNECCRFEVREAKQGDEVKAGLALVAPGDYHMSVALEGGRYKVHLEQGPMLHFTRPAVDVLFNSASRWVGPDSVAVLLTGMGSDGAIGMKKLKEQGVCTIVQDESTCAVYGMPRAAVKLGVVDHTLPLHQIANAIVSGVQNQLEETPHAKIG